jgi:hypothetical protein
MVSKGGEMNNSDLDFLTNEWRILTNDVNNASEEAIKSAQDTAYILGMNRQKKLYEPMIEACQELIKQYNQVKEYELGGALTNGPFLRIEKELEKLGMKNVEVDE